MKLTEINGYDIQDAAKTENEENMFLPDISSDLK